MKASTIIEPQPFDRLVSCLSACLEAHSIQLQDLQRAEQRFGQGVIPTIAFSAHYTSGWLYVVTGHDLHSDLFSRRVVGWSMKALITSKRVTDALMMATWRRGKPDALLHHSDRGSHYSSEPFRRLMADNGVDCSMSRSGNIWENAAIKSFFSSLKTERIDRKVEPSRDAARADVFDYIERFYNTVRRHSTIGYISPVEFERKLGLA